VAIEKEGTATAEPNPEVFTFNDRSLLLQLAQASILIEVLWAVSEARDMVTDQIVRFVAGQGSVVPFGLQREQQPIVFQNYSYESLCGDANSSLRFPRNTSSATISASQTAGNPA